MAVLALGMREVSKEAIAGNFYELRETQAVSSLFLMKNGCQCLNRLDFNNCTGPNMVRIELKISKINNRIDLN